jgi:uncharacterized protein YukE
MASWEQMAEQVIVLGRPGDVRGVAQGWQQLQQGCQEVETSLKQNITDLNQGWKGPAYESFKTHILAIAKQLDDLVKSTQVDDGIVGALNNAADKLDQAQQNMPVPAVCTADIIEARNVQASIPVGFFTLKLKENMAHSFADNFLAHWEYELMDWINNKTDDARKVYDTVQGQYQDQTYRTPGSSAAPPTYENTTPVTNNATSGLGGGGGVGGLPGGGGIPKGPTLGGTPPIGVGKPPGIGGGPGSGGPGSGGGLGAGGFDPGTASGLAGAGGGLSGAGLGGGLSGAGLAGAGLGAGGLAGGGAAGNGVMPSMSGLMGAGGAGLGGGRGAAGRSSGRGAMAGGHGGGHGDSEDERTTWLQEDDDPWGTGDGAPSGVLK